VRRKAYHEVNTYLSWSWELPVGDLTLSATDYFYPKEDGGFPNFGGVVGQEATGGHTLELGATLTPGALPLTFEVGWNAYNDPDRALFGAVSTGFSLHLFDLGAEFSMLLKDSPTYYEAAAGDLLDFWVWMSRSLAVGGFEPYASASLVRSALLDRTFWVFAVGF
jgi:hypothetical protein